MSYKPLIIAHRGASGTAPENTLAAFQKALDLGADMIELDVHLTGDDHLVVIHDPTLERTTNGAGRVIDHTLQKIRTFNAGNWFGPGFEAERVPSLQEVIELVNGRIPINIEVKIPHYLDQAYTQKTATLLANILNQRNPFHFLISSFDYSFLAAIHELAPSLPLAFLFSGLTPSLKVKIKSGMLHALHPHWWITNLSLMELASKHHLQVNVWTVDNPKQMKRLKGMDVNGIITNFPKKAVETIR